MTSPTDQLRELRDWQTLANYVNDQPGGRARTGSQFVQNDVCAYFSGIMYVQYSPEEVMAEFLERAKRHAQAKFVVTNWRNYLHDFQGRIPSLAKLANISQDDRKKFVKAITDMTTRMSVKIGGRTENNGGVVNVARSVVSEGEDTAIFALFHELGHGVQTEGDIPQTVKDAIYKNEQERGGRLGELFADAFAGMALRAIGRSKQQVLDGAQQALSDHGSDADHPDWGTRESSLRGVL